MKKYFALAALLAVAACGGKTDGTTTADSVGAGAAMPADSAAATMDSAAAVTDSTLARDSAAH